MTTAEAAQLKGVAVNSIIVAIKRGDLNAVRFGRAWNVLDDEKFRAYTPTRTQAERSRRRWEKEGERPLRIVLKPQPGEETKRKGKRTRKAKDGEQA